MASRLKVKRRGKEIEKTYEASKDFLSGNVKTLDGGLFKSREECYIGIDPSLSNFAITAVNDSEKYFIWEYILNTPSPVTDVVNTRRLLDIRLFINNTLDTLKVQTGGVRKITVEGYSYASKGRAITGLAELRGILLTEIVRVFGWANEVAYPIIIPSHNLKLFTSGSTKSEKNKMLLSVYKKWNVECQTDNGADSFGLAKISQRLYSGSTVSGALEYEKKALEKIEGNHPEWPKQLKKQNQQISQRRKLVQGNNTKSPTIPAKKSLKLQRHLVRKR